MKRQWNSFAEESPGLARIVTKWADQQQAEQVKATRQADRALERAEYVTRRAPVAITKGKKADGICLRCSNPMREKHPRCKQCGAKNRFHVKPERAGMKKRKITKAAGAQLLTKAARRQAFAAMAPSIYDPDPTVAEVAWKIRRGEIRWAPPGAPR